MKNCISVTAVSKSFRHAGKKLSLFENISLTILSGEIVGLFGPSGSGKSTLGNIMLGLIKPDTGSIFWSSENIAGMPRKRFKTLRPLYQKIYQDPLVSFPPRQTIREALRDLLFYRLGLNADQAEDKILYETRTVGLRPFLLERLPSQLSGGELQRFSLARTLLAEPLFIMADEPTSRLDVSVQARTSRLIQFVVRERKIGVLWISHDIPLLENLCSRIWDITKIKKTVLEMKI